MRRIRPPQVILPNVDVGPRAPAIIGTGGVFVAAGGALIAPNVYVLDLLFDLGRHLGVLPSVDDDLRLA